MRKNWGAAGAALRKMVKKCSAAGAAELKNTLLIHKRAIGVGCCASWNKNTVVLMTPPVQCSEVQSCSVSVQFSSVHFCGCSHRLHYASPSNTCGHAFMEQLKTFCPGAPQKVENGAAGAEKSENWRRRRRKF